VFYTDGSKVNDRVALAVVHNNTMETTRLPDGCSILEWNYMPLCML